MDEHAPIRLHRDGTAVTVWVVPGASRTEVVGLHGDAIKIRVAAPPESGKANGAVAELLASIAGAPAELVRGAGSRRKVFVVRGTEPADVADTLGLARPLDPK